MKSNPDKHTHISAQKGFTLIEAIVSSAVFAFVVVSVLGVYISTQRLDSKTRADRAVQENGRFIMEYIAKLVRNGSINYASYPNQNTNNTTTDLWVLNQANELEHIFLEGNDLKLTKSATTNLNSKGIKITKAQFIVSPAFNPLTNEKLANQQPYLTVFVEIVSNQGERLGDVSTLSLQSSFTSREYPSRE